MAALLAQRGAGEADIDACFDAEDPRREAAALLARIAAPAEEEGEEEEEEEVGLGRFRKIVVASEKEVPIISVNLI